MLSDDLLTWFGNLLNFVILIYLIRLSFSNNSFNLFQTLIAAFGLLVSILLHLYTSIKSRI